MDKLHDLRHVRYVGQGDLTLAVGAGPSETALEVIDKSLWNIYHEVWQDSYLVRADLDGSYKTREAAIAALRQLEPLTTEQAANELGISRQAIQRHILRGNLAAEKVGRDYLIAAREIERFKQERRGPGQPRKSDG